MKNKKYSYLILYKSLIVTTCIVAYPMERSVQQERAEESMHIEEEHQEQHLEEDSFSKALDLAIQAISEYAHTFSFKSPAAKKWFELFEQDKRSFCMPQLDSFFYLNPITWYEAQARNITELNYETYFGDFDDLEAHIRNNILPLWPLLSIKAGMDERLQQLKSEQQALEIEHLILVNKIKKSRHSRYRISFYEFVSNRKQRMEENREEEEAQSLEEQKQEGKQEKQERQL